MPYNFPLLHHVKGINAMASKRFDIYTKVHKGLRKALFEFAYAAGRTDYLNDAEVKALHRLGKDVILFLNEHARNEESYQLPLLEKKVPGAAGHDHEEHERIDKLVLALERELDELAATPSSLRQERGESFYHSVNNFIAGYLVHMREEEFETTRLFYQHCTDDELRGALKLIVANMPPDVQQMTSRYILAAITPDERLEILNGVKATAPPHVLNGMLGIARDVLSVGEYEVLAEELAV